MKKIRKTLLIITILIASTLFIPKVDAKVLTAEDVANKLREATIEVYDVSASEANDIFKVNGNIVEYYDEGILQETRIECNNGEAMAYFEDDSVEGVSSIIVYAIAHQVYDVNYNEVEDFVDDFNNFLSLTSEGSDALNNVPNLKIEEQDAFYEENGVTVYNGGYTVRLSLDTDVWDKIMEKYIEPKNNKYYAKYTLVPTITSGEINHENISIDMRVDDPDGVANLSEKKCILYRSNTKDGLYKRIQEKPINCSSSIKIKDTGLNPNTTYYYKARLAYTNVYSSILELSTAEVPVEDVPVNSDSTTTQSISEKLTSSAKDAIINPQTGDRIVFLAFLIVACAIGSIITPKRIKTLNHNE